jgi:hypothetical protein
MAQTRSRSSSRTTRKSGSSRSGSPRSSRAKTNGRSNGSSRAKNSNGSSRSKTQASSRAKTKASRRPRSQASANGVTGSAKGTADSLKDTVTSGAQGAATEITTAARKAKVPLLASGVALAGAAVTAVVATRAGKRRKVLGVSMPTRNGFKADARKITGAVSDAAKRANHFGQGMSRVATSVQKVSETADEAVKNT